LRRERRRCRFFRRTCRAAGLFLACRSMEARTVSRLQCVIIKDGNGCACGLGRGTGPHSEPKRA
jgi:hypothetical protein